MDEPGEPNKHGVESGSGRRKADNTVSGSLLSIMNALGRLIEAVSMTDSGKARKYEAEFGSELRKRQTPELARRQRGSIVFGSLIYFGVAVGMLIEAVNAIRTGKTVYLGRLNHEIPCSGYVEAAIALFAVWLYVFAFWGSGKREKDQRKE